MRKKSETIAFRADTDLLKKIDEQRVSFGISRGDWVRGIITTWLNLIEQNKQIEPADTVSLSDLHGQLNTILENQVKTLYLELVNIGNLSADDARTLARRLLHDKDESP